MSYTPYQAPLLAGLLGDSEIADLFSVRAELAAMLRFESELARAQAALELIPAEAGAAIARACAGFQPDIEALGAGTAADGVAVPNLLRQLREAVGEPHAAFCHFGSTSQDAVDSALVLRLKGVTEIFQRRLSALRVELDALMERCGANALMARTRMQAALPIAVAHRIGNWAAPIQQIGSALPELEVRLLVVQLGGPVGDLAQYGDRAAELTRLLAEALGVAAPDRPWHTDRSAIVEFSDWMARLTGALAKIGTDIALMAQNEIGEVRLAGAGGSSAMAHKQNPILAEVLVTLAWFSATMVGGMHQAAIHEQERSGSAWTLEWMLLPQLCIATGAALRNGEKLLKSVEWMGTPPRP